MTVDRGERLLPLPAATITATLLRPIDLPGWNPLFTRLIGDPVPRVGGRYELMLRFGMRGTFAYTEVGPDRIGMTWQVPGLHEDCEWTVRSGAGGTVVTHRLERSGPLSAALGGAIRGVADLRLDRLARVNDR